MKKIISVFLAVLTLLSTFSLISHAEPPVDITQSYQVQFVTEKIVEDAQGRKSSVYTPLMVVILPKGSPLTATAKSAEPPSYFVENEDGTTDKYYFAGWKTEAKPDVVRTSDLLPAVSKEITYIAVYEKEEDALGGITLLSMLANFFARINQIFRYFAKIFKFE